MTIPESIRQELAEYEAHIQEYRRGELGEIKMQKIRLQFGTYAQRQEACRCSGSKFRAVSCRPIR